MFKTWAVRYALLGFAIGLLFPLADTLADVVRSRLPVRLDVALSVHFGANAGIDRWLIDAIPFVLAALMWLIGRSRDRREQDLARLNRIADLRDALHASGGLESLLNAIGPRWAAAVGAQTCSFSGWDARSNAPVPLHPRGPFDAEAAAALAEDGQALAGWVIAHNRIRSVERPELQRTIVGVPLAVNDRAFAAALFGARRPFDSSATALAQSVADQVALTIDHLRTTAEIRRRARDMEAVSQVARRIAAGWEIDRILKTVVDSTQVRFGVDYLSICTVDESAGEFVLRAQSGPLARPDIDGYRQPLKAGLAGRAYASGQRVLARDVRAEPDYIDVIGPDVRSELIIPLRSGERVIGVMVFEGRDVEAFRDEDIEAWQILADQVAVAVENARLYEDAQQERRRLAAVLASTGDAVIVIDAAGRAQAFNRAAERLLSLGTDGEAANPLGELGWPQLTEAMRAVGDQAHVFELALNDDTTLLGNITPVLDPSLGRLGSVLVLHDISDLKRLDQLKSQMIRMASHDLRNPLNMAFGYLDLIQGIAEHGDDRLASYVDGLRLGLRRMQKLIEDLLDVERVESGTERVRQPVDLGQVLRAAADELQPEAEAKNHSLQVETNDAPALVSGDPVQIHQAVVNLLSNAIKYTPDGGRIVGRVWREDERVALEVEDNGLGIPRAGQGRLFERFYRIRMRGAENVEGTGLGLSLVKAVVDQHRGAVEVDSEEGRGSRFCIWLPALVDPEYGGSAA